jgi:ATP-binding cassette subfamily G (WHITE) protein 2
MKEQWRKRIIYIIQLVQTVIMAILTGTVYLQLPLDQSAINTRQSSLFFSCVNQGIFSALVTINSFPAERILSLRERAAGMD